MNNLFGVRFCLDVQTGTQVVESKSQKEGAHGGVRRLLCDSFKRRCVDVAHSDAGLI